MEHTRMDTQRFRRTVENNQEKDNETFEITITRCKIYTCEKSFKEKQKLQKGLKVLLSGTLMFVLWLIVSNYMSDVNENE